MDENATKMESITKRVTFAPSAYETVVRLAARRGTTYGRVLTDALQLASWLQAAEDEGWHVLLERNGRVRELARPQGEGEGR